MSDLIDKDKALAALLAEETKLTASVLDAYKDACYEIKIYQLITNAKIESRRILEDINILEKLPVVHVEREEGRWTPVSKGMPDEQYSDTIGDFKYILCTTIWGDVRPYKYGTTIGGDAPHFWHGPQVMDDKVIAWKYMPEPYTEGKNG